MYLWLNEPRINTKDFNISSIPSDFDPFHLDKAIQGDLFDFRATTKPGTLWLEYIPYEGIFFPSNFLMK